MNTDQCNSVMSRTYFISDAHLGAAYIADPRAHEQAVVAMLRMMGRDADAIYMLGDMLDFWFEYRHVIPKGFARFFGEVARLVDSGVRVYWFKGNHDIWTQGYLERELGVIVVDEEMITEIDGRWFYLSHGDKEGPQPGLYRLMRAGFRNEVLRRIGAALHPRWLMGFGRLWSAHNRERHPEVGHYTGDDKETQMIFARRFAAEHPEIDYFVFGHRHIADRRSVPGTGAVLTCLGDAFRQMTYAVFDGENLMLKHFANDKSLYSIF